jgi:AAA15 family ATPase/GTPase
MNDIQEVSIKNFRAIDEISFTPKRINIFVGPNNSGKSSAIEAIALLKSSENRCEDSLGVYVLGEIIDKYSMDYLFHDIEKPIEISYENICISIQYYSEGYPTDTNGSLIQDYINEITIDYINQPSTINRIRSRYNPENRYRSTTSRIIQKRLDGSLPLENQRLLDYEDMENEDLDERFDSYIKNLQNKIESYLYHKKKVVISGFSDKNPIFLYLILEKENMRLMRQQEEIFEFLRYRKTSFNEIHSISNKSTGFVSDYDTE